MSHISIQYECKYKMKDENRKQVQHLHTFQDDNVQKKKTERENRHMQRLNQKYDELQHTMNPSIHRLINTSTLHSIRCFYNLCLVVYSILPYFQYPTPVVYFHSFRDVLTPRIVYSKLYTM